MTQSAVDAASMMKQLADMKRDNLIEDGVFKHAMDQLMYPKMVVEPDLKGGWSDVVDYGIRPHGILPANAIAKAATRGPMTYTSKELEAMVRMRLRTKAGSFFDHWHMHKLNDEKVIILIVNDGQVTLHEDEWPLFPSDELVTKLRLLEK